MGGMPSKIKDKDRAKIYRRVELLDARQRYKCLAYDNCLVGDDRRSIYLFDYPVSINFGVEYSLNATASDYGTIYLKHFEKSIKKDIEYREISAQSTSYNMPIRLVYLLENVCELDTSNDSKVDTFLIGLTQQQYDWLFPTERKNGTK
jgi:hypothetical protein